MGNLFQDIVNTALIGTERRPYSPGEGEGAAGELIGALDASGGERALLAVAAVSAQYQRVGALAGKVVSESLPEPAPDETLPRCGPASSGHLMRMLNGTYQDALPEWLEAAASAGVRAPEEALPSLLTYGAKNVALREAILPVLGERGRWLAGLNRSWSYAAGGDDDDWQTASSAARLALLKRLRAADPDAARALVESTWAGEKPNDRAEFVGCFRAGLSLADEPFLESCLDDRSAKVTQAAAEMLARLPGSRFQGRMIDRVQNRVMLRSGARPRFDVLLWDDDPDDAARRDTIGAVSLPDSSRLGEKSMLIVAALRLTPLSLWTEKWNKRPAELAALAKKDDQWKNLLLNGWHMAAYLQGDAEWLAALMQHGMQMSHFTLDEMPADAREKVVLEVYDKDIFEEEKYRYFLFERCNHLWSKRLTEAAIELIIAQRKKKPDQRLATLGPMVLMLAHHMPTDMIETARRKLKPDDEAWERWQPLMKTTMETLEFRRAMLEALSGDR